MLSSVRILRMFAVVLLAITAYGQERSPAPAFSLSDTDGRSVALSDYRGSIVIVNFWATWCRPCRAEMPDLAAVSRQHGERGVKVLGIAMDVRGWAAVTPFLAARPVPYQILLGNRGVARAYGVKAIPHTVFIDRDGNIAARHTGLLRRETLDRVVKAMLGE